MTRKTAVAAHDNIETLNSYQAARKVTEMYLSSREPTTEFFVNYDGSKLHYEEMTFVPALVGAQREILDNAIDELVGHKGGNTLYVTFDPETLEFSVQDNGRGVRLDKIEEVFTNMHSGRNFNHREDVAGVNGVGSSVVNFTSEYFIVDVWRDGKHYHQEFRETEWNMLDVSKPVIKPVTRKHGTKITFKPSQKVYEHRILPERYVIGRLYELAFQYPELKIFYNEEKLDGKNFFKDYNPVVVSITKPENKFSANFYLIPNFTGSNDDHVQPVVNSICTYRGGEFIKAFRSKFYGGIIDQITTRKIKPNRADVAANLLVMTFARLAAPRFDSQAKNFVINEAESKIVKDALDDALFKLVVRKNKNWIESIIERTMERTNAKDEEDAKRASKKAKKAKNPKLVEANSADRRKCVLLIAEGDSALNKATDARDSMVHALLPLLGKIMNVREVPVSKVMANTAVASLLATIGLEYGKRADRTKLRYGKLYIATDEDDDGYHILCLLINLFYCYWPELFDPENPFIYKLKTPFIILKKGNDRKYIYAEDYDKFDASKFKGWSITRAKGLGSMEEREWVDALNDPQTEIITEDGQLSEMLDLMFNPNRADDRKDWLNNA